MEQNYYQGIADIRYNMLNLPQKIQFMDGHQTQYSYDATWVKRRVKHTTAQDGVLVPVGTTDYSLTANNQVKEELTTEYFGNIVYENNTLKYILTPEGYITKDVATWKYNYYLKDHLGNNRVVMRMDESAPTVIQSTNYYPFGYPYLDSQDPERQFYKFGGKELDGMHGLNMYDQGARFFGAVIPITSTMDPLVEKYYSTSPYAQWANNPVMYIDPTGMIVEDPDEIYKNHKEQMNSNLTTIQETLKGGGLSEGMTKALGQLEGSYKSVLKEYSTLEKSDQVYRVLNSESEGSGVYFDKGTIMIGIGDVSLGLVGHELKHAYQYEKGEISFRLDGKGFGALYDISDETAAYNRERMLNSGVSFFINPETYKWGNSDVRTFGKIMTPPAYQGLPEGPINMNSKIGRELRNSTINSGILRISPSDAYKGYNIDFRKRQ